MIKKNIQTMSVGTVNVKSLECTENLKKLKKFHASSSMKMLDHLAEVRLEGDKIISTQTGNIIMLYRQHARAQRSRLHHIKKELKSNSKPSETELHYIN